MKRILGHIDYLDFIDSFRYPLAGEIAIHKNIAHQLRLPTDWGLEIGTLNEIYRNYAKNQMCQVDILDNYDHKHQELGDENPNAGLAKMSIDIAKSFYRVLASRGVIFSDQYFRTIKASFQRTALDFIEQYAHDAEINGLYYDRHSEEKAIEVFLRSIILAGDQFLANPMELPMIPNWNRVQAAIPEFYELLLTAVELDNE
jgi:glucosyl-3-phosphoglycerate synthase